jgi:hypothetical protein
VNKTLIVAGSASVAALVTGATGGYFFAKRKFDREIEGLIAKEVAATKKYFSVLLMEAKTQKPESPEDIIPDVVELDETPELTVQDKASIAARRKAGSALVDYQGVSKKPGGPEKRNIFTDHAVKAPPARDPETGQFVPKKATVEGEPSDPYLIEMDDYLSGDSEYTQKQFVYFIRDNTLIDPENNDEAVADGLIPEGLLLSFPEVPDGVSNIICVRNDALEEDYEIRLDHGSLTERMNLGEEDPEDDYNDEEPEDSSDWVDAKAPRSHF